MFSLFIFLLVAAMAVTLLIEWLDPHDDDGDVGLIVWGPVPPSDEVRFENLRAAFMEFGCDRDYARVLAGRALGELHEWEA